MPQIDTDSALINAIRLAEQSGDPAVAGTGGWKLYVKSGGLYVQKHDGTVVGPLAIAAGGGLYTAYLCYQDQKASGTNGGTFTSGAWQHRDLNTEVADTGNHGSVAANQITLDAGTYDVEASAPAYSVGRHQIRLYDTTGAAALLYGTSEYCGGGTPQTTRSVIQGRFTIGVSSVLQIEHRSEGTYATLGFGIDCGFGVTNVYTTVALRKIG